jgi:hypothetical protein
MEISEKEIEDFLEKSPIYKYIFLAIVLLFGIFVYYAEDIPIIIDWKEKLQEKVDEYRERAIVSMVVKDNEIQNNSSSSFRNIALYLLESYDVL